MDPDKTVKDDKRSGDQDFIVLPDNPPPIETEAHWFESRGGLKLRMMYAPEPKGGRRPRGTVIVCPGRSEFIEKYFEVARDLQEKSFAVAVIDWPGQGRSERLHKDPKLGHVRHFGVYVDALARTASYLGRNNAPRPFILLCHSMGGAIALETLRQKKIEVAAAAFSAPMWGLRTAFYQRWLARGLRLFGQGGRPVRSSPPEETFDTNILTHDEARWRLQRRLVEADPRLATGEPTIAWVVSSLDVTRDFMDRGALDHLKRLPALVAIPSEEALVSKAAQRRVGQKLKSARLETIHGASHEILMEIDKRRAQFWEAFDDLMRRIDV